MPKKYIVTIIIIVLSVIMFMDFRLNGIDVFESYFRQMETDSVRNLRKGIGYGWRGYSDQKTEKTYEFTVDPLEATELFINNRLGSIKIKGEDRQDVKVSYKLTVYADTSEQAEEFIQELEVESRINGSRLELMLARLKYPDYIVAVLLDYDLLVPRQLALDLTNRFGGLLVSNMANDVDLADFYGEMVVDNIGGKAEILSRYGSLDLSNIEQASRVNLAYGRGKISNVRDNLILISQYSAIELDNLTGKGDFDLNYGSLSFDQVNGEISLNSRYAGIVGEAGGEFKGKIIYGELTLHGVQSNTSINSRYADLNLYLSPSVKDFRIDCRSSYGAINSNLPFRVLEVGNQGKELKGESGSGAMLIDLDAEHASIRLFQR